MLGGAEAFVDDTIQSFRNIALSLIGSVPSFGLDVLKAEQARLEERLQRFGDCADAMDIWRAEDIFDAEAVPIMSSSDFIDLANRDGDPRYDAR